MNSTTTTFASATEMLNNIVWPIVNQFVHNAKENLRIYHDTARNSIVVASRNHSMIFYAIKTATIVSALNTARDAAGATSVVYEVMS